MNYLSCYCKGNHHAAALQKNELKQLKDWVARRTEHRTLADDRPSRL